MLPAPPLRVHYSQRFGACQVPREARRADPANGEFRSDNRCHPTRCCNRAVGQAHPRTCEQGFESSPRESATAFEMPSEPPRSLEANAQWSSPPRQQGYSQQRYLSPATSQARIKRFTFPGEIRVGSQTRSKPQFFRSACLLDRGRSTQTMALGCSPTNKTCVQFTSHVDQFVLIQRFHQVVAGPYFKGF